MKQSDPLELVAAGSLARPGPVGRLVRLSLGMGCLLVLGQLLSSAEWTSEHPLASLDNRIFVWIAPLLVFNYVVNIGFTRNWGQKPLIVSLIVLATSAALAFIVFGSFDHRAFGIPLNLWLGYFYTHLGVSFVLSALIATPGCEMRAIPEIIGRVRGHVSEEHHCPAGFITRIDEWEQRRQT